MARVGAAAGVREMSIWMEKRDIFLMMVCDDYAAATAFLDKQPKSLEWEEWMAPIMETGAGGEYDPANAYPSGLPEVFRWEAGAPAPTPAPAESPLVLYYLPVRARAENIRMMLAYAGVAYEDRVIPFAEWKAEGGLKWQMPFGQLPAVQLPGDGGRWPACSLGRTLPACWEIATTQQADGRTLRPGISRSRGRAAGRWRRSAGSSRATWPRPPTRTRCSKPARNSRPSTRSSTSSRER